MRSVVAVALALLVASLVPVPPGDVTTVFGVGADAVAHVVGYAVLTLSLARSRDAATVAAVGGVVAVAVAYGAGIELLQSLAPTRTTSVVDGIANGVGAVTAGGGWLLSRRSKRD